MTSHTSLTFLCLAVLLGAAAGLTVGPVRLMSRSYITYSLNNTANNSVIECVYQLDEGEKVSQVVWKLFDEKQIVGEYVWSPRAEGKASGRLQGVVNISRDDAALHLTTLQYNLSGEYSCSVELSSGEVKEAAPWEVLIVDIIGASYLNGYSPGCLFFANYESPTVFPEPTLRAGMYSKSHGGYLSEVSSMEWLKVLYPNDSMAYAFKNFTYKVDSETPKDVFFEVSMGITKANGEYISLGSLISNSSSWSEYGCPDVKEGNNKNLYYFPGGSASCRGGRRATTKATITCKRGYRASGNVATVVLRCDGETLTWTPEKGHTARDEDLVCVKDYSSGGFGGSGSPRTAFLSSSLFIFSLLVILPFGHGRL